VGAMDDGGVGLSGYMSEGRQGRGRDVIRPSRRLHWNQLMHNMPVFVINRSAAHA
jgi:hypothetical protein